MRVPYEPVNSRRGSVLDEVKKILTSIGLAPWPAWMRRRLNKASIFSNDYVFGLSDSGRIDESRLLHFIRDLPNGTAEFYFHPEIQAVGGSTHVTGDYEYGSTLDALVSPRVIALLGSLDITPARFSDFIAASSVKTGSGRLRCKSQSL